MTDTSRLGQMPPQLAALVAPLVLSFQTDVTTQVTEDLNVTLSRLNDAEARAVLGHALIELAHQVELIEIYRRTFAGIGEVLS